MGRIASPETQLRQARSILREVQAELSIVRSSRDEHRARATKAEQEVAEWRKRFDLLLARTPESLK